MPTTTLLLSSPPSLLNVSNFPESPTIGCSTVVCRAGEGEEKAALCLHFARSAHGCLFWTLTKWYKMHQCRPNQYHQREFSDGLLQGSIFFTIPTPAPGVPTLRKRHISDVKTSEQPQTSTPLPSVTAAGIATESERHQYWLGSSSFKPKSFATQ